eukprot:4494139-Prymnesium_polylepis.1
MYTDSGGGGDSGGDCGGDVGRGGCCGGGHCGGAAGGDGVSKNLMEVPLLSIPNAWLKRAAWIAGSLWQYRTTPLARMPGSTSTPETWR